MQVVPTEEWMGVYKDNIGSIAKGVIFIGSGCCLGSSIKREEGSDMEYSVLILMSAFGLGLLVNGKDLLPVYLGLELQAPLSRLTINSLTDVGYLTAR